MKDNDDASIMFRGVNKTIGRAHHAGKDKSGLVVLGTEMPGQLMFTFHQDPPRLVLGRESFWLQGFPIDELEAPCFNKRKPGGEKVFTENNFQDLAGNMVSTPVMLAAVLSTFVAVSWVEDEPAEDTTGQAHGDVETASNASSGSLALSSHSPERTTPISPAEKKTATESEAAPAPMPLRRPVICRVIGIPNRGRGRGRFSKGKGRGNVDDM